MNDRSPQDRQTSPSCATRTPRRRGARHSPYDLGLRQERMPSSSFSAPPSAAPASPASSASSLPPTNDIRDLGGRFALSSAQWSSSSREGSVSSDDAGVSAGTSRFSEETNEKPCRLNSHHRHSASSPQYLLPSSIPGAHINAPRMIHPPPSTSAPLPSHSSHARHSYPNSYTRPSFERTVSAGPSTSRQPHATAFARTSSSGPSSAGPSRSRPSERRARRVSPYTDVHNRGLNSETTFPAASWSHEDEGGEDRGGLFTSSSIIGAAAATGGMGRLPKRLSSFKKTAGEPTLNANAMGSARSRPRALSAGAASKGGKPSGRKKKSNAGRVDVPVAVICGKRRYLCPADPPCDCHFSRKNDAYRHLDDRHGAGMEQYVCGCGRKLSRRDALHRHYSTCQWVKANRRKSSPIDGESERERERGAYGVKGRSGKVSTIVRREVMGDERESRILVKVEDEEEVNAGDDEGGVLSEREDDEEDQLAEDD